MTADEQLERVVEQRGVGAVRVERGRERGLGSERPLARLRPRHVALDRVDLAVVTEHAERLRALPARLRVRREPLVEDRERDRQRRILEIGVEARELPGGAQRLVGDGAEGERRDVDAGDALGAPTRAVRAALGVRMLGGGENELFDPWQRGERGDAQRGGTDRHAPPAGRSQPLGATGVLDGRTQPPLAEEAHREPGLGHIRSASSSAAATPRAVPRDPVGRPRAAMPDGGEARERAIEQLSRRTPAEIRDEADPAGTAFASRVVEEVLRFAHPGFTFRSKEGTPAGCF